MKDNMIYLTIWKKKERNDDNDDDDDDDDDDGDNDDDDDDEIDYNNNNNNEQNKWDKRNYKKEILILQLGKQISFAGDDELLLREEME